MSFVVSEHPSIALRRLAPDPVQVQVILGSLLGDGRIVGCAGARRLRVVHRADRAAYVLWKRERLAALADGRPVLRDDGYLVLHTITHPLFDDLVPLFGADGARRESPHAALELLTPLGLAVWLADLGRLELRPAAFLPAQAALTLATVATAA